MSDLPQMTDTKGKKILKTRRVSTLNIYKFEDSVSCKDNYNIVMEFIMVF